MAINTKNTNQENSPTNNGIPPNLLQNWEALQRKYYAENYSIIDFEPTNETDNYWRWHLNLHFYKSSFQDKVLASVLDAFGKQKDFVGNDDLKVAFLMPEKSYMVFWVKLEEGIQSRGFFVPKGEIARLEKGKIEPYLLYLQLMAAHFPFVDLLKKMNGTKQEIAFGTIPLPLIGMWHFIGIYASFLKKISDTKSKEFKQFRDTLAQSYSPAGFANKLPSQQIWELIQAEFQIRYFNGMTAIEQQDLAKNAHQEVQRYWEKYADSIRFIIEHGYGAITARTVKKSKIYTEKETKDRFFQLFREEQELVKIQEILDPLFLKKTTVPFLKNTHWQFRPERDENATERMSKAIGDKSILDRIKESEVTKVELINPLFSPPSKTWQNENQQKWYEFTKEERRDLLASANKELNLFQRQELETATKSRWNLYLQKFANQLFSPFFYWEETKEELIPQWNVLDGKRATNLDKTFDKLNQKEQKESANLEKYITYLYDKKTLAATQKLVNEVKPFSFEHLQSKWDKAAKAQLQSIRHKGSYRMKKMEEFGMLKGGRKPDKKLERWLDELLQIEKEIGPYIPFVKKAFLMALPTQTSTEFDPYRHSHDGIEFDPETTQDQHKWMRGEVMKALRTRTGKADAEQVNAFALDFSGSMRHKRMRNLFKILYLMVLGLEDRKSYDAFHFFGAGFIETVNFSDNYTNRSLLFSILQQIARLDYEGVRYGGIGGTNMSEGIFGCHERIKIFSQRLKEKYPKRFFLKSIFVITDGEPSLGLHIPEALNLEIQKRRREDNVAIKGIYLKPKGEKYASFMDRIFGANNFVETDDFAEAINRLVYIMTQTYKQQRKELRQQKIKEKYERNRQLYQ